VSERNQTLRDVEELASRLDDAWAARGDYGAEGCSPLEEVDVLRALCGEALMAVREYAECLRAGCSGEERRAP
jgi:hypothetical protein